MVGGAHRVHVIPLGQGRSVSRRNEDGQIEEDEMEEGGEGAHGERSVGA